MLDEETVPIVVGVGRYTQPRGTPFEQALSPVAMMARTSLLAAADSGLGDGLLSARVDCVAVVQSATETRARRAQPHGVGAELYTNWPRALATAVGAAPAAARCYQTHDGGNSSQMLVNAVSDLIAAREVRCALLSGCEVLASLVKQIKRGEAGAAAVRARWCERESAGGVPPPPAVRLGPTYASTAVENRHGLQVPVRIYPMLEQACRAALGRSVPEHMAAQSAMFAGFSEVAAAQPEHAWFPRARTAAEIASPDAAGNRWVGFPYTKFHCAVMDVDQSASVLLMSVAEARRAGVPPEKWVFLHGCADTVEKEILKRPLLHRSPAMAVMGRELARSANVSDLPAAVQFLEIYSCFPVAVSIVARELGIEASDGAALTLTGGLPYHGGPGSNFSMHGLVAMVPKLRARREAYGLVTANGGFLSKHAAGLYSCVPYGATHPDAARWQRPSPSVYQAELDDGPEEVVDEAPEGRGVIETYTVLHGADGLEDRAIVIGKLRASGARFVAISRDGATLRRMKREDVIGHSVSVSVSTKGVGAFELAVCCKL